MPLSAYDWLLARRTFLLSVALGGLVFAVMLSTDDAASTHAGRAGRFAALVSLAGGAAAFIAIEQARSRGELRAIGAAGVQPVKAALGAVLGGAAFGAIGPIMIFVRGVDLGPLFPRGPASSAEWVARGQEWIDVAHGVAVRVGGELARTSSRASPIVAAAPIPKVATALALGIAAIACPLWATARGAPLRRSAVALVVAAATVAVFHLVAADHLPTVALVVPPVLLALDAIALHRRLSWP